MQILRQSNQINRLLRLSERNHPLENPPVRIEKEIISLKFLNSRIERVVIEQNRAKYRALSIQIMRQRPFEIDVNSHLSVFAFYSPV